MIQYTVKYRCSGRLMWRKLKKVVGDGRTGDGLKFFTLSNDKVIHIPLEGTEIIYGPERMRLIEKNMSKEAGQKIERG